MIVAAAVCPHPPLLTAEYAASVDQALLAACLDAVGWLAGRAIDRIVVVGGVPGIPAGVARRSGPPLSIRLGGELLDRVGFAGDRAECAVPDTADLARCLATGRELSTGRATADGLLVMGDGSAAATDPRAELFDEEARTALAGGDAAGMAGLESALARELRAEGRAAWQVLAGAVGTRPVSADLRYAGAPYGVTYVVATWSVGA